MKVPTSCAAPGLRERKKQKTRATIISVALDLFAERGYEQTTIAEIAEAADVSPRTIFAYFASKEDIVFFDHAEVEARLAQALRERPAGATALDALRTFIVGSLSADNAGARRKRVVASDESLQRAERSRMAPMEQLMIEAIAEDLHAGPDDIRPKIVASALIAGFNALHDPCAPPKPLTPKEAMAVIDEVISFTRGGLEALTRP